MVGQKSLKVQTKSYRFVLGISDPLCVKVRPYFLEELLKKMLVIDISFVIVHTYMEFLKSGLLYKNSSNYSKKIVFNISNKKNFTFRIIAFGSS